MQDLAKRYANVVTSLIPIQPDQWSQIRPFLVARNRARQYPGVPRAIEAQDWLLADPRLSSRTGSEKGDTAPAVDLAVQLAVLWPQTLQRTWLGSLVLGESDTAQDFRDGNRDRNPFLVSEAQKLVFAWACARQDATMLSFLTGLLIEAGQATSQDLETEVRSRLPGFVASLADSVCGDSDRHTLRALNQLAESLSKHVVGRKAAPGGITAQTMRRVFEQFAYWRLESLVDLGYITKPNKDGYAYASRPALSDFRDTIAKGIERGFFQHWRRTRDTNYTAVLHGDRALEELAKAARLAANQAGYSGVEHAVLLANMNLIGEGRSQVLELEDARSALLTVSEEFKVITSVDRMGRLAAYKVTPRS